MQKNIKNKLNDALFIGRLAAYGSGIVILAIAQSIIFIIGTTIFIVISSPLFTLAIYERNRHIKRLTKAQANNQLKIIENSSNKFAQQKSITGQFVHNNNQHIK